MARGWESKGVESQQAEIYSGRGKRDVATAEDRERESRRQSLELSRRRIERARRFSAIAQDLGVPPAPLAVAWCLRNPHVSTVMLGATRKEQLLQNLEALDLAERFDDATWSRIEAATA